MGAIEDFLDHPPPPPLEPLVGPVAAVITPVEEQESWMKIIERYQKLRTPEFQGGSDPLVVDWWKEDVGNILDLMGVDSIPKQRLAIFSLKGDASK